MITKTDWAAVLLCVLVTIAAGLIAGSVFENMAHLEDEFAYLWQAKVIEQGELTLPSPDFSSSFLIPFVIDHQGERFGKYPLGWPVLLSLAIRSGFRDWINPILAGIAIWLVYRFGKRYFSDSVGILAALLLATSPFFLIQAGTLLSHIWSLVLSAAFTLFWLDVINEDQEKTVWWKAIGAGLCLGLMGLTRPLTMVAISIPFLIHGLLILFRGSSHQRGRILMIGTSALLVASLHFVWQWALTGDFLTNPYTLWWPYDKYGFGPEVGVLSGGHSPIQAWRNTKHSLRAGLSDLFGWGMISWLFLPLGLIKSRKSTPLQLVTGIFFSLVILYSAYWVGARLLGPRYYFEALPGLVILTAVGISWLAGWKTSPISSALKAEGWRRFQAPIITGFLGVLIFFNLYYYLPARLGSLKGLYGIERSDLAPFETEEAQDLTPALVIVHSERWMSYGSLLELESPDLSSPFIFAWSSHPNDYQKLVASYLGQRTIIHYFPNRDPKILHLTAPPGSLIE